MANSQTTVITTNITQQGIITMQLCAVMGIPFTVTKIELSENRIPSGDPEIWQPSGQTSEAYYIQTTNVTNINTSNTQFIFDITLGKTMPRPLQYNGNTVVNGWVVEPTEHGLNNINIGSYAVFTTNPVTKVVVPFLIAYVSPSNIEKYSTTNQIVGNIVELLTNFTYTLQAQPQLNYVATNKYKAQVAYIGELTKLKAPSIGLTTIDAGLENGGFLLLEDTGHILFNTSQPVLSTNIPNNYVVADIQALAYTDSNYLIWRFTNYISLGNAITIDAIAGNLLVSAQMFSLLPTSLQNAGALTNNVLIGEIYDNAGFMKQCFIFTNSMGNNFTANTALPALISGDKLICFISNSFGI